ncbi:MAG: sensor histidine kinase [Proteobacteria bacterium]|nr:sensor histidine kinase [Pseudomonadota bacterium]
MNRKESLIDLLIHDLTGPLSIASTSINSLIKKQDKYGPVTGRQGTTLNMALRNINKARTFLNEIIEVYRSEEGLFRKEFCSIQDLLRDALIEAMELIDPDVTEKLSGADGYDKFSQLLEDNGVTIDITGKYNTSSFCHDRTKIQQILRNLITNALKYRQKKVAVTISGDTELIIAIENDGSGISQEKQDVIFNRFSHLKDKEENDMKGLGFGLSCVKTIIETMNGNITLSSSEGRGTCFTIRIPSL